MQLFHSSNSGRNKEDQEWLHKRLLSYTVSPSMPASSNCQQPGIQRRPVQHPGPSSATTTGLTDATSADARFTSPTGLAVDTAGNAYVTGSTSSSNFPLLASTGSSIYQGTFGGGAGDAFVFGAETRGLPDELLDTFPKERRLLLPMRPASRSLNLANSVAVVVYEAWRQNGFASAERR